MLATFVVLAWSVTAAGDRGNDPTIRYPDALLIQNGGPVLDVKRPPSGVRAAKGDRKTDDTEALRDAYDFLLALYKKHEGWSAKNSRYIFLPAGTYLVSDTIIYRGKTVGAFPDWNGTFDINRVRWIGERRNRTVVRLKDQSPGFQDAAKPKSVLSFQHPDTVFNNLPGCNFLRNLTIDVGLGNPGAAAVLFQAANQSDIRNVTLRGAGRFGLWMKTGSIQGYYTDLTIEGFDVGIKIPVNAECQPTFEYITIRSQREAGIDATGGGPVFRKLLSVQKGGVPTLRVGESGVHGVVLESDLRGDAGPAISLSAQEGQTLLVRNTNFSGYASAVNRAGAVVAPSGLVRQYLTHSATSLFSTATSTLDLPVQDAIRTPYLPPSQWAIVEDYPSPQAAFDSGKPVVAFRDREPRLKGDIRVPPTVKAIFGMASDAQGATLIVHRPSSAPLVIQDGSLPIRIEAQRDVVQRCSGGGISNPGAHPVNLFVENTNDNSTGTMCMPGSRLFARCIDIEYANAEQIIVNGGTMWILGFKTENATSTPFTVRNRGTLEILGGYCNATAVPPVEKQRPVIRIESGGRLSASLFTNLNGDWQRVVSESRNGEERNLSRDRLPKRGGVYWGDYSIPLYVSP